MGTAWSRPALRGAGHRLGQPLHGHPRRLAPAVPHPGLRRLRRPDHAHHRRERDRQRHLRRAARGERLGRGGHRGRPRGDRPRQHRHRRPQLRRVHDRQPARPLRHLPDGHRPQRRLQPLADPLRLPERAPHLLGGDGHLRHPRHLRALACRAHLLALACRAHLRALGPGPLVVSMSDSECFTPANSTRRQGRAAALAGGFAPAVRGRKNRAFARRRGGRDAGNAGPAPAGRRGRRAG